MQDVEEFFLRSLKGAPMVMGGQGLKAKIRIIARFGLDLRFSID
jgi:hypothetical protein